ncbi:MAG: DUF3253 domain-containing protein [Actinomycetota bacterium]
MSRQASRRRAGQPDPKICRSCGREITWRKAWANSWDEVRYCSAACRTRKIRPVDTELEAAIEDLLDRRAAGATICPSEAARAVAATAERDSGAPPDDTGGAGGTADTGDEAWRALMEPARAAARRLVAEGRVEITQRGQVVDPSRAKGPIRIRRVFRAAR